MYMLDAVKSNLARLIGEALETTVEPQEVVVPPKPDMGDLAYGCFKLAKERGLSPNELAKTVADKIQHLDQSIECVEALGPYVNFKIKNQVFVERVIKEIEARGDAYGAGEAGRGQQVMLEFANVNTHKEFHVGHLRNILLGLSVHRILDFAGWKTIPVSYINDYGSHVAKCLWLFVREHAKDVPQKKSKTGSSKKDQAPALSPEEWTEHVMQNLSAVWVRKMIESMPVKTRTGSYLGDLYVEASKLLEENDDWKKDISFILQKLEAHDPAWTLLWQETKRWSMQEFYRILQDFNVSIHRQYFESEVVDQSIGLVHELLDRGIAMESQGAVIIDLDAYPDPEIQKQKLGVLMLRKTDGTLIYATKDVPLAELKFMEYPEQVLSIIVVDSRQSLYFKQLFATLKLLGYDKPFKHLAYEFVTLPEGAMASRKGNVILLKDLMQKAFEAARQEVLKRHDDWNEGKVDYTAWCISQGGVNFALLKQDPEKVIVFDIQKALSFEGDTGPYVQYALTRLQAIVNKGKASKKDLSGADLTKLEHETEKQLAVCLAQFPEVCARSAALYRPSLIAQWLLEAASKVNAFYRDVQVLDAPKDLQMARLRFILAAQKSMTNGLRCLGINVPDAM